MGEEDTADVSFLLILNKLSLLPIYFFSLVRKLSKCMKAKEVTESHCFFMGWKQEVTTLSFKKYIQGRINVIGKANSYSSFHCFQLFYKPISTQSCATCSTIFVLHTTSCLWKVDIFSLCTSWMMNTKVCAKQGSSFLLLMVLEKMDHLHQKWLQGKSGEPPPQCDGGAACPAGLPRKHPDPDPNTIGQKSR